MFEDLYKSFNIADIDKQIKKATSADVKYLLSCGNIQPDELPILLSPAAAGHLEDMAQLSFNLTRQRFGNTIQLYAPIYISNECSNSCLYCGFNCKNQIARKTLNFEEIIREAEIVYAKGFRHILFLTGEAPKVVPVEFLEKVAEELHRRFDSISIEIYPMSAEDYKRLIAAGVDGLTVYQETYNQEVYSTLHPAGKKRDFFWRLGTPDRAGEAGMRKIGIGALMGLTEWRSESFFTALHAWYLQKTYWKAQIQVSMPRIRKAAGNFVQLYPVEDSDIVQFMTAMRIFLPDASLVLSTRERAEFRDQIMRLGITQMSAESATAPGGYGDEGAADEQFAVEDPRTAQEVCKAIIANGLEPVWKDWDTLFIQ